MLIRSPLAKGTTENEGPSEAGPGGRPWVAANQNRTQTEPHPPKRGWLLEAILSRAYIRKLKSKF